MHNVHALQREALRVLLLGTISIIIQCKYLSTTLELGAKNLASDGAQPCSKSSLELSCQDPYRCGKIKYPSIVKLRRKMRIPSVEVLKMISIAKLTWKRRSMYREMESNQLSRPRVITENMKLIKIPVSRGLSALSIEIPCWRTWNALPNKIKLEDNRVKAFRMITSLATQRRLVIFV